MWPAVAFLRMPPPPQRQQELQQQEQEQQEERQEQEQQERQQQQQQGEQQQQQLARQLGAAPSCQTRSQQSRKFLADCCQGSGCIAFAIAASNACVIRAAFYSIASCISQCSLCISRIHVCQWRNSRALALPCRRRRMLGDKPRVVHLEAPESYCAIQMYYQGQVRQGAAQPAEGPGRLSV